MSRNIYRKKHEEVDRKYKDTLHSLLLLGTLKNYGLAGGPAVLLFSRDAALPEVVLMTFMILYKTWLDFKMRWT